MSFSFEFHARVADVATLLKQGAAESAPTCVKDFICQAVQELPGDFVSVSARGHLFNKDYQVSSCVIEVRPITISGNIAA